MPVPINVISLPEDVSALPWTGERFIPGKKGQIEMEHLHRYVAALQLCHDKEVLDIASGEGYGCFMLAQVAKKVIGVDIDQDTIRLASEKYSANDKMNFKVGSCSSIPLMDNSVDVVISFETIEHIKEQEAFILEVKRVLKNGGIFIVSTPDRVAATPLASPPNHYHIRELYREEFYQLLKKRFNDIVFFGQRSITGSLIFPDGRTAYDTPGDELFFATADPDHKIECIEFFPRVQNIIAIVSDALPKNFRFSSSIYEGVFGTLDILNNEYDSLAKKCHSIENERNQTAMIAEKLKIEFDGLQEQNKNLEKVEKQNFSLQLAIVIMEELNSIKNEFLATLQEFNKLTYFFSLNRWSRKRRHAIYTQCLKQYHETDSKLLNMKKKIYEMEKINGQLSIEYHQIQKRLFDLFLNINNVGQALQTTLHSDLNSIKNIVHSIKYRLGMA